MALLQCEMCCGELEISTDKSIGTCKYCGSTYTIPKEIEKKGNLFNRANFLRQSCNFDEAIGLYESILAENEQDADALWGLVLCRYGIEFVEDPKTKTRIPTCHRASKTSILLDSDYKSALKYADEDKRRVYQDNATRIDQIQKAILAMSNTQEKYDVFICYKESDDFGERTEDSVLAQEIYNELTRMNVKTFYARKTLEGKLGSSYEPIIYSALNSAKVMIVLGTKPEYLNATWVKNEWSRYLSFMNEDSDKNLIPAYKGMSAYELPEEFRSIQAVDMSRIGAKLDLCDGIQKLLRKNHTVVEQVVSSSSPVSKESLYTRANVFISNREFAKATDYFEKVLDSDPQLAGAYWGSLLAAYRCTSDKELIEYTESDWTNDVRLKNALTFSSGDENKKYSDVLDKRVKKMKELASEALNNHDYGKCGVWCDRYISNNESDPEVWSYKLLSGYNASSLDELVDICSSEGIWIDDKNEYQSIIRYSDEAAREIYMNAADSIKKRTNENGRRRNYEEGKNYMQSAINDLSQRLESVKAAYKKDHTSEMNSLISLKKSKSKFYYNNFFILLITIFMMAIFCYAVVVGMNFVMDTSADPTDTFFHGLGFGLAAVIFVYGCKYLANRKAASGLMIEIRRLNKKIELDKQNIAELTETKKNAEQFYEAYASNPGMPIDVIVSKRQAFDAILQNH